MVAAIVGFLVAEELDREVADEVVAEGLGVVDVAGGRDRDGEAYSQEEEFEKHVLEDGVYFGYMVNMGVVVVKAVVIGDFWVVRRSWSAISLVFILDKADWTILRVLMSTTCRGIRIAELNRV